MPEASKHHYSLDRHTYYALARRLETCAIHPNVITLLNMGLGGFIVWCVSRRKPIWVWLVLLHIRAFLDCYDGHIARACGRCTRIGNTLDLVGDAVFYPMLTTTIAVAAGRPQDAPVFGIVTLLLLILRPEPLFSLYSNNTSVFVPVTAGLIHVWSNTANS